MDIVRLFLKAAVGEKEIESYIEHDYWVEFPTRELGAILEEYEAAKQTPEGVGVCPACHDKLFCAMCGEHVVREVRERIGDD